jgi:RHS repeat-associated protein
LEVTGARTEDYSYDENGKRTMTGYVTGDLNQLLSDGTYDYTYDLEGNLLTKTRISDGEVTEYTWDYRQRLVHVVVKEADEDIIKEVWYTYDVFDRRIGVVEDADGAGQDPATERWTAYDGDNAWADFDDTGSLTTRYLYGPAIDQIFARIGESGDVDWYLTDHLGSVRQIVQTDSTILDEIDYDSFGQILNETSPANGDRFKYTAREWDAILGQYYYRARYYGPDTGRFFSEDPSRYAAGDTNLYRYVGNSPSNYIDPEGLQARPSTIQDWIGNRVTMATDPTGLQAALPPGVAPDEYDPLIDDRFIPTDLGDFGRRPPPQDRLENGRPWRPMPRPTPPPGMELVPLGPASSPYWQQITGVNPFAPPPVTYPPNSRPPDPWWVQVVDGLNDPHALILIVGMALSRRPPGGCPRGPQAPAARNFPRLPRGPGTAANPPPSAPRPNLRPTSEYTNQMLDDLLSDPGPIPQRPRPPRPPWRP